MSKALWNKLCFPDQAAAPLQIHPFHFQQTHVFACRTQKNPASANTYVTNPLTFFSPSIHLLPTSGTPPEKFVGADIRVRGFFITAPPISSPATPQLPHRGTCSKTSLGFGRCAGSVLNLRPLDGCRDSTGSALRCGCSTRARSAQGWRCGANHERVKSPAASKRWKFVMPKLGCERGDANVEAT